ncbi:hypothetical protein CHLRE_02g142852v5 [Chlamydomonas reinhardtii]|uniref:Uncharacterized protein n=1 Tax=Chlamydomonas reinhardtii TaxID=3055 RepID=A0A2K3E401_CHLRE|nr:uncharacterized protein CHLRE_02g142852v5 [Chlamydomonas reinhardtii]PNW87524.1 hypothetical protein CHLRE_02g142852v5 [Chlamydomonas reinhardtii]
MGAGTHLGGKAAASTSEGIGITAFAPPWHRLPRTSGVLAAGPGDCCPLGAACASAARSRGG